MIRDWGDFFIVLLIAGSLVFSCLLVWAVIEQHKECDSRGGKMVGTGEYTTTVVNTGNGVLVPVQSENIECTK